MRFFNWAKNFEEQPTCGDILKKVRKTEIYYWVFVVISVLIAFGGLGTIEQANEGDMKQIGWGIFLIVLGLVNVGVIKIWAHLRLVMYYMIWDRNHWIEAEIKKNEAADI